MGGAQAWKTKKRVFFFVFFLFGWAPIEALHTIWIASASEMSVSAVTHSKQWSPDARPAVNGNNSLLVVEKSL